VIRARTDRPTDPRRLNSRGSDLSKASQPGRSRRSIVRRRGP
jgi:hypothetical protein